MITPERFSLIKEKYGNCASWAVWASEGANATSNISDLSIFDSEEILETLNPNVIVVGLNISRDDLKDKLPFANFHSDYPKAKEYKLRRVLKDTSWWGAYLTDVIKDFPEIYSGNVLKALNDDPEIEINNIKIFLQEIKDLGSINPTIVALGWDAYRILKKHLLQEYNVTQITHFSATNITLEDYKQEVLERSKQD